MQKKILPLVSILVPAFNEAEYITTTLNALVSQDYPSFEIIVIDNASTDATAASVEAFVRNHVQIPVSIRLLYEPKKGTNYAREAGRRAATGSIIAQVDADCIPGPDWLKKGLRVLLRKKNTVAVTGPYDYYDGDSFARFFSIAIQKTIYPIVTIFTQALGKSAILIGGNTLIKTDALDMVGGYNTGLTFYGDDVELGKRLIQAGHIVYDPSLVMRSSFRRYRAMGFWQVNKKYQDCFWKLVWGKASLLQTTETQHPR